MGINVRSSPSLKKPQQLQKSSPELSAFVSTRNLPAGVKLSMGKTVLFKMVPLQFSNTLFDSLTFTQFMRRQVWEIWSINYGTPSRARQKQLDHKSHQDLKKVCHLPKKFILY